MKDFFGYCMVNVFGAVLDIQATDGGFRALSSYRNGGHFETAHRIAFYNGGFPTDADVSVPVRPEVCTYSTGYASDDLTAVAALSVAGLSEREQVHEAHDVAVAVIIDADVPISTMTRAAITANEAVTCVFQQLLVADPFTGKPATGSNSICITVLCNPRSEKKMFNAGKHSKLGELIGKSVIEAVYGSMMLNGVHSSSVSCIHNRLLRFGTDADYIPVDGRSIAATAAVCYLADCIDCGLIPFDAGLSIGKSIIDNALRGINGTDSLRLHLTSILSDKKRHVDCPNLEICER